jgi:hypothetical protein
VTDGIGSYSIVQSDGSALGPAPQFSVVANGTLEEIQKVVDGGFDAFKVLSE